MRIQGSPHFIKKKKRMFLLRKIQVEILAKLTYV